MKRGLLILAMLCLLVAPLAAVPEPTAEEVHANRARLEMLRKHQPEQLERLRGEAKEFFALPKEQRKRIVEIHKELQKQTPATRARWYQVLDRYVDWLDDLDKPTQARLAEAKDKNKRLDLLRELREQEWIKDQPKATRDKLAQLQGDARKAFIAKEKADERQRRFDWQIAKNFWNELESEKGRRILPTRSAEFSQPVQNYLQNYLFNMFLSQDEKDQLAKLEGHWPQYPMKLVEFADKHPPALPGPLGPKSFAELPTRVYNNKEFLGFAPGKFKKDPLQPQKWLAKALKIKEGAWPEFGVGLATFASQRNYVFEHEFLAYKIECLSQPMQDFVQKKLKPALDNKETLRLLEAYGKWPDYPQTIQELAHHHHLQAPWFILPKGENWENYRLPKMTGLLP